MVRILRFVRSLRIALFGIPKRECRHVDTIIATDRVHAAGIGSLKDAQTAVPIAFRRTLQCRHCGRLTSFEA